MGQGPPYTALDSYSGPQAKATFHVKKTGGTGTSPGDVQNRSRSLSRRGRRGRRDSISLLVHFTLDAIVVPVLYLCRPFLKHMPTGHKNHSLARIKARGMPSNAPVVPPSTGGQERGTRLPRRCTPSSKSVYEKDQESVSPSPRGRGPGGGRTHPAILGSMVDRQRIDRRVFLSAFVRRPPAQTLPHEGGGDQERRRPTFGPFSYTL